MFQEKNNGGLGHSGKTEKEGIWALDARYTSVRINKFFEFMDNFGVGGITCKKLFVIVRH